MLKRAGLWMLVGTGMLLLVQSLLKAAHPVAQAILGAVIVLYCLGVYQHVSGHFVQKNVENRMWNANNLKTLVIALLSTVITYSLNVDFGLGAVVASGLIGLAASLILPKDQAVVAYTGSFAGMSSSLVLTGYPMVTVAGLLVGFAYVLTRPFYQGYGGKLGTIAAASVMITGLIFSLG